MEIPVYHIEGKIQKWYIFGTEKLLDFFQDNQIPAFKWDELIEDLEGMVVISVGLYQVEQKPYKIGEKVTDNAGHDLQVVTVTASGEYVVSNDSSMVKYYQELDLKPAQKQTESVTEFVNECKAAAMDAFIFGEPDDKPVAEIKPAKTEHQEMMEFFFKRNHK